MKTFIIHAVLLQTMSRIWPWRINTRSKAMANTTEGTF